MSLLASAGLLDLNATLLVELIAFVLMVAALARWAYPRIISVAEARQEQIEAGLRAAEQAEKRLLAVQSDVEKTLEEARAQARAILSRANAEATADAEEVRQRSRREAEAQVERARSDITAERDRALQELRAQVSSLVVDATSRVLGQAIDRKTHQRLISESIAEVQGRTS